MSRTPTRVLIVPELLKGGFFFGAEYGIGILLVRDPQTGSWGPPAFYSLYGGSVGLQFGGQTSDVVFTIMNQGAVDKLLDHGIKLGADAGMAAGRLGVAIGAATTTHFGEDIYAFAKSQGLFGGFWVDGTYIRAERRLEQGLLWPRGRSAPARPPANRRGERRDRRPAPVADPLLSRPKAAGGARCRRADGDGGPWRSHRSDRDRRARRLDRRHP